MPDHGGRHAGYLNLKKLQDVEQNLEKASFWQEQQIVFRLTIYPDG